MSKYSKISAWYFFCICIGLGTAWSEGVPVPALVKSAIFGTFVVAGIFIAMFMHEKWNARQSR